MPGLLGPTNPVPGYEQQPVRINTPAAGETNVQNTPVVDPTRVVRPDAKTEQQDSGDATGSQALRYESNFATFLQRLRDAQDLPETFLQVLRFQGKEVASGIQDGFAAELSQFLEFLNMDETRLRAFLQNQLQSASRFSGALFDALRAAYNGTSSELLKNEILKFLQRYSDYSSTAHLEGKMLRTVEDMTDALPGRWAEQLSELLGKLQNGVAAGDRQGNLELLRGQLFPMISQYVKMTHDHGTARGLLSMLTLDVARYENGAEAGLLQSMRSLSNAGVLPRELAQLSDAELLQLLRDTEFSRAAGSNAFADNLAKTMERALKGEGGSNLQEAFRHIMSSVLINESVYMPLNHIMLPMEYNGQLMFSEMWVDPDADKETGGRDTGGEKTLRVLIKLDVASLGAFDLLIDSRRESVSLAVACPAAVSAHADEVSGTLSEILRRNGLTVEGVSVTEMRRPIAVSEAFPKVLERMGGVNVKV